MIYTAMLYIQHLTLNHNQRALAELGERWIENQIKPNHTSEFSSVKNLGKEMAHYSELWNTENTDTPGKKVTKALRENSILIWR